MTTKPLRRDAALNRERLLTAAAEVFASQGLDASLEEIARRAEVSIGTLYNHFKDRDGLIAAVLPERIARTRSLVSTALSDPDPWNGFRDYVKALLEQLARDKGVLEALLSGDDRIAGTLGEACRVGAEGLTAVVDRAQRAGRLRDDITIVDVAEVIRAVSLLAHVVPPVRWHPVRDIALDGLHRRPVARP